MFRNKKLDNYIEILRQEERKLDRAKKKIATKSWLLGIRG